jgi:hypothetical protein
MPSLNANFEERILGLVGYTKETQDLSNELASGEVIELSFFQISID